MSKEHAIQEIKALGDKVHVLVFSTVASGAVALLSTFMN